MNGKYPPTPTPPRPTSLSTLCPTLLLRFYPLCAVHLTIAAAAPTDGIWTFSLIEDAHTQHAYYAYIYMEYVFFRQRHTHCPFGLFFFFFLPPPFFLFLFYCLTL
ncbi:hypothetical protein AMATHDRAFT_184927, partial [Amanita thiersii Skay4041]